MTKEELQAKIDSRVEAAQEKCLTKQYIDKKIKLETENELLTLEFNNLQLKENLKRLRAQASGLQVS